MSETVLCVCIIINPHLKLEIDYFLENMWLSSGLTFNVAFDRKVLCECIKP